MHILITSPSLRHYGFDMATDHNPNLRFWRSQNTDTQARKISLWIYIVLILLWRLHCREDIYCGLQTARISVGKSRTQTLTNLESYYKDNKLGS
jgi:hypothetical protein